MSHRHKIAGWLSAKEAQQLLNVTYSGLRNHVNYKRIRTFLPPGSAQRLYSEADCTQLKKEITAVGTEPPKGAFVPQQIYGYYRHEGINAPWSDYPEMGQADLEPGREIRYTDSRHHRLVRLEWGEFDGVYRVIITHQIDGRDDRMATYYFDFVEEHDLDLFLYKHDLGHMKRSGLARRSAEETERLKNRTEEDRKKSQEVGWE